MSNEDNGIVPPSEPSALKSLLNPITSEGATPSSTVPEPPKSPRPDPATVTESAPVENQSVHYPVNGDNSLPPLPTDAPVPPSPKAADEPPPVLPEGAIPPAVSTPSVITVETPAAPPAMAEPTPAPEVAAPATATEIAPPAESAPAPPVESAPAPPAESAPGPPPAALLESAPAPNEPPAPAGVIEPTPTPAEPAVPPFTIPTSDAMDVDQPEPSPAGSLKRSGEDLEGREEKRTRDEVVAEAPQAPVPASAPPVEAPAPPATAPPAEVPAPQAQAPPVAAVTAPAAQAPVPAPVSQSHIIVPGVGTVPVVIPPPPVASGPTTPFTLTQHKHMLSCIRSLKKNKDAALFLEPVNPILFGIPHYPDIIKNPMDLGTVETKLIVSDPRGPPKDKSKMGKWDQSKGKYNSVADLSLDVRQIFWNTARFNGMDHLVTQSASRLDAIFAKMIANIPAEPVIAPPPPPPAAGPSSHARRASVSQPPVIRRTSDVTDRPKREIHPPPSKDLAYADAPRKPKRRNDPQLQWALKTIKVLESTNKTYDMLAPFLFPVEQLLNIYPDYASVIKRPMDLLIIKQRLTEGEYDDISQVDSDMKLMFSNALKYNPAQDPVAIAATQFQQLWAEKMRSVPPKYVSRDSSEDPIGGTPDYDSEDEHDEKRLAGYREAIAEIEGKIEKLKSRQAQRHASRPRKPIKKAAPAPARKASGGPAYGNGNAKKARKIKEYRDDEEDEITELTPSQKEDLANKIQAADATILNKALEIIARSQDVASDGEIELDIEALPRDALLELYALVVGPLKKGRKSNYVPNGRKPGRKPGGPRKSMNEEEEVLRIARMEEQLQSFNRDPGASAPATGYEDNDSESSEDEDSDLD